MTWAKKWINKIWKDWPCFKIFLENKFYPYFYQSNHKRMLSRQNNCIGCHSCSTFFLIILDIWHLFVYFFFMWEGGRGWGVHDLLREGNMRWRRDNFNEKKSFINCVKTVHWCHSKLSFIIIHCWTTWDADAPISTKIKV